MYYTRLSVVPLKIKVVVVLKIHIVKASGMELVAIMVADLKTLRKNRVLLQFM